jgi:hypothetical protein
MKKTIEENFIDWESNVFGYGYGTGEMYTIPATKDFFGLCPFEGTIDYKTLENHLTPTTAWLLINIFCKADLIEYGTSLRYSWLTNRGKELKKFLENKKIEEIYELFDNLDNYYIHCSPNYCNCSDEGYKEGLVCDNPFWKN